MKKYHIVLSLLVVASLFTSCKKDEKTELDFDLSLPDNWSGYVYNDIGYIYEAHRNPVDQQDTMAEALVIFKNSIPGYTLPVYFATLKQQIQTDTPYDSLTYVTDTVIDATDFMKMVSHEFKQYFHASDTDTVGMVTERYFFIANDFGYNFTFVSVDTAYPRAKPEFDDIISSFHYKK
ncbi:MAG TPA: hypothetical protein VK179_05675 [Bacteroidales bacterium]|nr:hypothetical protein [Bacteroidales bacterium]